MTLNRCLLAAALSLAMAATPALAERRGGTYRAQHRSSVSIATYRFTPPHKRPRLHAMHSVNHHSSQARRSLLAGL